MKEKTISSFISVAKMLARIHTRSVDLANDLKTYFTNEEWAVCLCFLRRIRHQLDLYNVFGSPAYCPIAKNIHNAIKHYDHY